jgi:alkylated DNA repair dioxygenase AlkB
MASQQDLFESSPRLPEGFKYSEHVLSEAAQESLLNQIRELPFETFKFHGYEGKRRVVSFGWRYDFNHARLDEASDIPPFLLDLRATVSTFANLAPANLQQVLVTEYEAGAGIGWHKDKAVFGEVVGISLLSACVFRLRRKNGSKWDRVSLIANPGSAYLLSGPARSAWEHSIPAVDTLRYSITFRNLRAVSD